MDDEKKWNLNAPQNDTENNRQNEPPRYEHYCMHQNTESDTVKELPEKKKNKKRGGKKLAETISLAVVFGLVAGVVFQGVNFASEKYLGSDGKDSQIETAQLAGDSSADGSDSNESEGAASNETVASETAAAVSQTGSVAEARSLKIFIHIFKKHIQILGSITTNNYICKCTGNPQLFPGIWIWLWYTAIFQ